MVRCNGRYEVRWGKVQKSEIVGKKIVAYSIILSENYYIITTISIHLVFTSSCTIFSPLSPLCNIFICFSSVTQLQPLFSFPVSSCCPLQSSCHDNMDGWKDLKGWKLETLHCIKLQLVAIAMLIICTLRRGG